MDNKVILQAAAVATAYAVLIYVLARVRSKGKYSNFDNNLVDDNLQASADGCLKMKPLKPNTWNQIGQDWIWVNEKGNLTING